jgi:heme-degrading monooxygenase HmoA
MNQTLSLRPGLTPGFATLFSNPSKEQCMFLEIAEIHIRPGEHEAFEEAIGRALRTITAKAKGVTDYKLHKGVESPERYVLQISWESVEDHMVTYINSPEREVWRSIVSKFFARPPNMEHFTLTLTS